MDKARQAKVIAIVALLVAAIGLTIAYAAMSTTLQIKGTGKVEPASWDIKFENLTNNPTLTGGARVVTAPTIQNNATYIGDYSVVLTKPGDSVAYTFDVTNDGAIDAILSSLVKAATPTCTGTSAEHAAEDAQKVCSKLNYTLKYSDGTTVSEDDTLNKNTTRHMVLKLELDSSATELPSDDVNITGLDISLIYGQN